MLFSLLYFLVRRLLGAGSRPQDEKDIELLVPRHQVRVLQRQVKRPRLRRLDRVLLAAASRAMPRGLWSSFVVRPETLLRWHRELVRRKWTHRRRGRPGRPPIEPEVRDLIVRLGRENPRWGYQRIRGELLKLGIRISATTADDPGAPRPSPCSPKDRPHLGRVPPVTGSGDPGLRLLSRETIRLKRIFVLFFIELQTRRAHVVGVTTHPDSAWITQQARNLAIDERLSGVRFLVRDRDAKFSGPFDEVLHTEGVRVIRTPIRAPRANAFAEVRENRAPGVPRPRSDPLSSAPRASAPGLRRSLRRGETTSGLSLAVPAGNRTPQVSGTTRTPVERRGVLGGLIHEYRWAA